MKLGRAVVTKGQRRLGRTIRRLESSVEFSAKESKAKIAENQYKQKVYSQKDDDSPVENLRDTFNRKRNRSSP